MTYKPTTRQLAFVLPLYFSKAEIVFTRPRELFDSLTFRISPNLGARYEISTETLEKGTWTAQLLWSVGRSQFCQEKLIEIG